MITIKNRNTIPSTIKILISGNGVFGRNESIKPCEKLYIYWDSLKNNPWFQWWDVWFFWENII